MINIDAIIREVNGTMAIEGMPLTDEDKRMIRDCLIHNSFEEVIAALIAKYSVPAVPKDA